MFQSGRKLLHERGRGFYFLQEIFGFIFIVFAVLLYWAVLSLSNIPGTAYQKKRINTIPGVCTYVLHASEHSGRNRPRREAYVASELFSPEAWRRDS